MGICLSCLKRYRLKIEATHKYGSLSSRSPENSIKESDTSMSFKEPLCIAVESNKNNQNLVPECDKAALTAIAPDIPVGKQTVLPSRPSAYGPYGSTSNRTVVMNTSVAPFARNGPNTKYIYQQPVNHYPYQYTAGRGGNVYAQKAYDNTARQIAATAFPYHPVGQPNRIGIGIGAIANNGPISTATLPQNQPMQIGESRQGNGNFNLKYELKEVLGEGSTSMCYKCVERHSGHFYACKIIEKRVVDMKFKGLLDQFHNEISVLQQLRHPNIIYLKDSFENEARIHIILELMEGGELFDFVVNRGTLSEGEASKMLRGVTSAITYMHSMNIIHRDLKPENLLISKNADIVKIIDFGLSKMLDENTQAQSFLGTRGYLAPEMLQREAYSKAVDVWALGVICFVLLCGCLPFDDDSSRINKKSAMSKFVLRFPRWAQNLSPDAKNLLGGLLDVDPNCRITAQTALDHPWMQGISSSMSSNMLESPKALREQLPRIRSPQILNQVLGGPTSQRKADFEVQKNEYREPPGRERKYSI